MISIADIPFPRSCHDENFNIELVRYRTELQHFVRKKPTRQMRVVKRFLDINLKDPDQDAQVLERELSTIYNRFRDEQRLKKKFNRLRPLKSIKKSKDVQKKKDYGDYSSFKEYHEYLELFADNDCSLFNDLKTKEKTNADIFREILLKSRIKANIPQLKSRSPLQSQEEKKSQDLLNGKSKNSVVAFNRDSSMILSMTFKGDSSRDVFNKSNTFNPSNSNLIISQQRTLVSKKQSPAETYVSGKEEIGYHKPNNRSFAQEKSFTAERIEVLDSKDVLDLKDKILRHVNDRPRFNRKEIPFQFDKNFIGSRKIQERKFDFERRNGLLPRTLLNLSFGK